MAFLLNTYADIFPGYRQPQIRRAEPPTWFTLPPPFTAITPRQSFTLRCRVRSCHHLVNQRTLRNGRPFRIGPGPGGRVGVAAADTDGRVGVPVRVLVCGSWLVKGWPDACTGSAQCAAGVLRVPSGVGQPSRALCPGWSHPRGPSHSSTARLLVMMKLDTPCRWSMRSWRSADCWAVNRCRPRSSRISRSEDRKDLQVPLKGVVDSGLGHCPEVVVGMDEADSVSRPDGGVAQGLGQENSCPLPPDLPTNLRCHAVTAGADSPVSRLCTGRIRA